MDQLKRDIEKLTAGDEVFLKNGKELKKPEFKIVKLLNMDKDKEATDKELDWIAFKASTFSLTSSLWFWTK
jgi:hypothetical protein